MNLKWLPKAPITVMEPLTPEETKKIIDSINKKARTGDLPPKNWSSYNVSLEG